MNTNLFPPIPALPIPVWQDVLPHMFADTEAKLYVYKHQGSDTLDKLMLSPLSLHILQPRMERHDDKTEQTVTFVLQGSFYNVHDQLINVYTYKE